MQISEKKVNELFDRLDNQKSVCVHKMKEAFFSFRNNIVKQTHCENSDIQCLGFRDYSPWEKEMIKRFPDLVFRPGNEYLSATEYQKLSQFGLKSNRTYFGVDPKKENEVWDDIEQVIKSLSDKDCTNYKNYPFIKA